MRRASSARDVWDADATSHMWRAAASHMRSTSATAAHMRRTAASHMRRTAASDVRRTTAASGRRCGRGRCSAGWQSGRHQDQGCADGSRDLEHELFPARCMMRSPQNQ